MSNLPPLPLIDGALFIDNSFLDTFVCPRKTEYQNLHKLIPANEAPALNFGSAIHLALEYRYSHPTQPLVLVESVQAEILRAHFKKNPQPEGDHRDLNFAISVIQQYNSRHMIEPFNVLKYDKPVKCRHCAGKGEKEELEIEYIGALNPKESPYMIPCIWCSGTGFEEIMVELPFAVPLFTWEGFLKDNQFGVSEDRPGSYMRSIPVIYTGRIDLPVFWDDQLFLIDHKTTSQLGKNYFDQYRMSAQMLGYCWAWQETTKKEVAGFAVNALRSSSPTKKMLNGAATKSEIEKWWSESFFREKEYIQQHKLEEWRKNTIHLIEEFMWHYSRDYMPQKTKSCTMFGRCGYYDVCYQPADQRKTILESTDFKVNEWNPLHQTK